MAAFEGLASSFTHVEFRLLLIYCAIATCSLGLAMFWTYLIHVFSITICIKFTLLTFPPLLTQTHFSDPFIEMKYRFDTLLAVLSLFKSIGFTSTILGDKSIVKLAFKPFFFKIPLVLAFWGLGLGQWEKFYRALISSKVFNVCQRLFFRVSRWMNSSVLLLNDQQDQISSLLLISCRNP